MRKQNWLRTSHSRVNKEEKSSKSNTKKAMTMKSSSFVTASAIGFIAGVTFASFIRLRKCKGKKKDSRDNGTYDLKKN